MLEDRDLIFELNSMANKLNIDLEGKHVIAAESHFKGNDVERVFLVDKPGTFGAKSFTNGTCLGGTFIIDGEQVAIDSYDIDRLATDEEIAEAQQIHARQTE